MKAKDYLNQAYRLDCRINSKLEQLERLKTLAQRTTVAYGGEAVSRTRNVASMEDIVIRIMEAEQELDEQIDTLIDLKREIQKTIDLVADADCRMILELRYLCMRAWKDIGTELNLGRTRLHELHGQALNLVETVLRTQEAQHAEEN